MLTFGIILAIVAIIVCGAAMIFNLINHEWGGAFFMFLLVLLNVFILVFDIERLNAKNNGEVETKVVKDVIGYSIDSITVINGTDTTKTYTLTYWKEYE